MEFITNYLENNPTIKTNIQNKQIETTQNQPITQTKKSNPQINLLINSLLPPETTYNTDHTNINKHEMPVLPPLTTKTIHLPLNNFLPKTPN